MKKIIRKTPKGVSQPVGNYSHITKIPSGLDTYVFSGQIGICDDGTFPSTFNEEVKQLFINIKMLLQTENIDAENITKVNIWSVSEIDWDYFDEVWNGNGFVTRGIFIHVPTFLNESKNFQNNANFLELKSLCEKVDLVIWDDIAANKLSSYEQNLLISLIDSRQNNQLANIFTSNITLDNLDNNVGQRLASRLVSGYKVVLRGHDMRRSEFNGNSTDFE